jgi:hypothetical protein
MPAFFRFFTSTNMLVLLMAPHAFRRTALFTTFAIASFLFLVVGKSITRAEESSWTAVVSPAGSVTLIHKDEDAASMSPGLFESSWRFASLLDNRAGEQVVDGIHRGRIPSPSGIVVDVELKTSTKADGIRFDYQLTPRKAIKLNSLNVTLTLPAGDWAGGRLSADNAPNNIPNEFRSLVIHAGPTTKLDLQGNKGKRLRLEWDEPTMVLVQDDRQWGQSFSVRIGPQLDENEVWPASKILELGFTLSSEGGMKLERDEPMSILLGNDWLPLDVSLDIEPGSALDFSTVIDRHAPAGKLGRVIVNPQGKFAFASQPDNAVRFYGVNLCFSSQYLDHATADRLAERLWRLGYNALRIHHYESELVDRSSGKQKLIPAKLDQLDYLLAALKKRGIYVTTDLFVSRPVAMSTIYPDYRGEGADGDIAMDDYKMAVPVNERAYEDYKAFATALLTHVNPYTQMTYAEDPMLAWLSLVNENCPGNFIRQLKGPLRDDWQQAWNQWLTKRYPNRAALVAALGDLPADQDPIAGTVPLQDVYGSSPSSVTFNVFLAETELDFFERTKAFLRDEIGCEALLTDLNAWTNPVQLQAVRNSFDYVDDHFYVDHPEFLERPWSLPSKCPNTNPLSSGATGGRNCAFTRLYDKPFTITEYNYSSPGRFRGVGGILTGTLGAIQDWDGIWRFSYAHSRESVKAPGRLNYFDVASDPLNLAAERASLCLFLRGDLQAAAHGVAIKATRGQLLDAPSSSRDKTPPWNAMAWVSRVGWTVATENTKPAADRVVLLYDGNIDPFASDTGDKILSGFQKRQWLADKHQTDFSLNRFQSETGEVLIDAPEHRLVLDTPRTAGGFAPASKTITTQAATISILDNDATVWVSSLEDAPITSSKRLLVTHLTDLQNTNAKYADRGRKVLLAWGRLPHLVQTGRATIALRIGQPDKAIVYGLSTDGKRLETIETSVEDQALVIPLDVNRGGTARMLYEVVVEP